MDARDSTIARLEHQIKVEQKKLKDYEDLVPELEEKLSDSTKQFAANKKLLDERTSVLHLTKKHLKIAREKNMVCYLRIFKVTVYLVLKTLTCLSIGNG